MEESTNKQKESWKRFYENWKKVWRDPEISVYQKAILFDVFLYRSDEKGWCISERKIAKDLGVAKQTASNGIGVLRTLALLEGERKERKRGKLRLSGLLRSPEWITKKSNTWAIGKSTKYQSKEQINNSFSSFKERAGKTEKILNPEELSKRIRDFKERMFK